MKIRNVKTLTQSQSPEKLALAAQLSYRSSGKRKVAEIIKGATTRSPENPRTFSTRYCWPIRFRFIEENPESIRDEFQSIENQIQLLEPTKVCTENSEYLETHVLIKTMVDGKVCNTLVQNPSAQVCYICGASPKQINNLQNVFFLNVRQGSGTTTATLLVAFLKTQKKSAEIKEVEERLIHSLSVILKALSCRYDIDTEDFRIYGFETAQMYIKLFYTWFYMPASVHKILIHGTDVMDDIILPIAQLSEYIYMPSSQYGNLRFNCLQLPCLLTIKFVLFRKTTTKRLNPNKSSKLTSSDKVWIKEKNILCIVSPLN
ncbi:hypothetical protein PR048_021619 [Dryococelus australis]|uniref:Uncharacterized protein n=1 Tax=Dryococelus australis TaxID=614101 RepID=A0ABQ9GYR4_9NEOP|nr:hypothetical protein PR048_021619 [Dryococelus australis]